MRQWVYCRGENHLIEEGMQFYTCAHCINYVPLNTNEHNGNLWKYLNDHRCYMRINEPKIGKEEDYWVWDIETIAVSDQTEDDEPFTKLTPYLLCMMRLDGSNKHHF